MAKPPETTNIRKDDMPEAPAWVEKLLGPINGFILQVKLALSGGLTVRENMAAKWVRVQVTGGTQPKPFPVGLGNRPAHAVLLASATGAVEAPVAFTWAPANVTMEGGRAVPAVSLTRVTGIPQGKTAYLTFLVLPE